MTVNFCFLVLGAVTALVLATLTLLLTAGMVVVMMVLVMAALVSLFTAAMVVVVVMAALALFILMMFMHGRSSSFYEAQTYPAFPNEGLLFFSN